MATKQWWPPGDSGKWTVRFRKHYTSVKAEARERNLYAHLEKFVRDFRQAKHNFVKRLKRLPDQTQRLQTKDMSTILRSELHGAKKVVSVSLYGTDPRYFAHLETMLRSYETLFPDYTHRFYVSADIGSEVLKVLRSHGAEIVTMLGTGAKHRFMFWRFLACEDIALDRVLVRDVDHVALPEEKLMVQRWEESGKRFHIIRAHYSHNMRVMGGLWGAVPEQNFITKHFSKLWRFQNWLWGADQIFLERYVYPTMRPSLFVNEIYQRFADEDVDLVPVNSVDFSFVGEPAFPISRRDESREDFRKQHLLFVNETPSVQENARKR